MLTLDDANTAYPAAHSSATDLPGELSSSAHRHSESGSQLQNLGMSRTVNGYDSSERNAAVKQRRGAIVFGEFRLVPAARTLTRNGSPVRLGARALEILIALIERAGLNVSKAELFAIVWPTTRVEESNLRVQLSALRRALGDGRSGTRFIVNVAGRGYTFVGEVERTAGGRTVEAIATCVTAA